MDTPYETSLLAKVIWSGGVVIGLTLIAERVSTRIAGVLSGAPLGSVLMYLFVGQDKGMSYVLESIPHALASFSATLVFVVGYFVATHRLAFLRSAGCLGIGVVCFIGAALVLVEIKFNAPSALVLTIICAALTSYGFKRIEDARIVQPVRFTLPVLLIRGGAAALLVVSVVTIAEALGPRWTGILTAFPMTLLPTLLIVHATYGAQTARSLLRGLPVGIGSILIYILAVSIAFPALGVYLGTLVAFVASAIYLTIVINLLSRPSRIAPTPNV